MKHAVLVGSLPPPSVGDSLAFQMLVEGVREYGIPHTVINISMGKVRKRDGSFSSDRLAALTGPFLAALSFLFKRKRSLYLTIAQSWNGFLRDAVFILCAWLGGYRIILHLHGGNYDEMVKQQSPWRRRLIRFVLTRATKIVVLGEALKGMFSFLGDCEDKVVVVHNGLPVPEIQIAGKPKNLDPEKPVRLLYLSNMIESKGYLDVLNAVKILVQEFKLNVDCHFCGQFLIGADNVRYRDAADAEQDFIDRTKRLGLVRNVKWLGVVSGVGKADELRAAHMLVLPTRYNNEGQPLCIVEAMAAGCVPLSTNYRTIPEMLDFGRAGVFVQSNAPQSIAEAVDDMVRHPAKFSELSEAAISHYRKLFSREVHWKKMISLIVGEDEDHLEKAFLARKEGSSSGMIGDPACAE